MGAGRPRAQENAGTVPAFVSVAQVDNLRLPDAQVGNLRYPEDPNAFDLERSHTFPAGGDSDSRLQRDRSVRKNSIQPATPRRLWPDWLRQALQEVQPDRE